MIRGKPSVVGRDRVLIRVLLPRTDYETLRQIAEQERTDISALVRRAISRYFLIPGNSNGVK